MKLWGKSEEETPAALEAELKELRDKAGSFDSVRGEFDAKIAEKDEELTKLRLRLAALETRGEGERTSERKGRTDWSDDADTAFNERVAPIVAQTQRQGEILARQTARGQLQNSEHSRYFESLFTKYGGEIDQLYSQMDPGARLSHEAYLNCVHVVEGRHRTETFELMQKAKAASAGFEGEAQRRGVEETNQNTLTADEEAYCRKRGFSDAEKAAFLKNVRNMQFSGVA